MNSFSDQQRQQVRDLLHRARSHLAQGGDQAKIAFEVSLLLGPCSHYIIPRCVGHGVHLLVHSAYLPGRNNAYREHLVLDTTAR